MEEIRDKHSRELQERAANDMQSQAMIKNELATVMQRVQVCNIVIIANNT